MKCKIGEARSGSFHSRMIASEDERFQPSTTDDEIARKQRKLSEGDRTSVSYVNKDIIDGGEQEILSFKKGGLFMETW